MAITDFITHSFSREADSKTRLRLRDSPVPPSEQLDLFARELKTAFQKRAGREYGCFDETQNDAVLPQKLKALLDDSINFVAASVQWMQALQAIMDELDIVMHGHAVFMREEHLGDAVFYLFVLSDKESLVVNSRLEVERTRYVDFGTTLMAAKVELSLWQANASRSYLTLAVPRTANIWVDTFRALAGFANTIDKKAETESFLQSVSTFSMELPDDSVSEFQAKVVDFCLERDKQGEAVEFDALSGAVAEVAGVDGGRFAKSMAEACEGQDNKLHVDRNSMRRYLRFTGREKDLTVSFASTQMPERVRYDTENDVLTIRGLPKSLREQLLKHLQS
ncbi:MAG: nucleoid-associated protein [Gammaproteobacteria bacterium]|nr:nucleoid-associated protein [Gammaproteobacteria bacterium]